MTVPYLVFFDLPLLANALGAWSISSGRGVMREFYSRTDALAFAVQEARKIRKDAKVLIRIEGGDRKWRVFDSEMRGRSFEEFLSE